ncbi:unnamed protein product, partial [Pocillopora meandrina]
MEDDASFQGFYLEESTNSARNKEAFASVAEAINNDYGGAEQCPWSPAQLKGTLFLTYLRSLKDGEKRKKKPGKVKHKIICRRQGRLLEVILTERMDWDDAKKDRCQEYLTIDYTSSDESELSEDE